MGGLILGKHVVNISSPFHSSIKFLNYKPFEDWEFDLVLKCFLRYEFKTWFGVGFPKRAMEDVYRDVSLTTKKTVR